MLYRKLGKNDDQVSILGFGCMRFPVAGANGTSMAILDPNRDIDEEEAVKMIRYAFDHGVNYFDTAYPYHGGKSETVLGKAVAPFRNDVLLATKLPTSQVTRVEDFNKFLDEQLKRLNTPRIDVYLLHGLGRLSWSRMKDLHVLKFLDEIRRDGRTRLVGFSFHDDVRIFREIVDSFDWSMCQIQYNYFDENFQAGKEGLAYAASKGLGVVVMEPLRGGKLADRIPESVQKIWESAPTKRTPADWGLRWIWNHPEVTCVLSGMSAMGQVKENTASANQGEPNSLTDRELSIVSEARTAYKTMLTIPCTGCAYCVPCQRGINIPLNFSLYNDMFMFKDPENSPRVYNGLLSPQQRASNCAECGECETRCPQGLKISEELKRVAETLAR